MPSGGGGGTGVVAGTKYHALPITAATYLTTSHVKLSLAKTTRDSSHAGHEASINQFHSA